MTYGDDLARAVEFARIVHAGAVDKQGQPYIGHPLRVMAAVAPDVDDMCAAVLHDTIEDGPAGTSAFIQGSQKFWVWEVVDILTKRRSESYPAYIRRVIASNNSSAIGIKLADLADNLDERRGPVPVTLRGRYERARADITAAIAPSGSRSTTPSPSAQPKQTTNARPRPSSSETSANPDETPSLL